MSNHMESNHNIVESNIDHVYSEKIESINPSQKKQSIHKTHISVMAKKGNKDNAITDDEIIQLSQLIKLISDTNPDTSSQNQHQLQNQIDGTHNKDSSSRKRSNNQHSKDINNNNDVSVIPTEGSLWPTDVDQLIKLKKLIDELITTSGNTNTQQLPIETNKPKQEVYSAPTPTVYAQKKKHKHINLDELTFAQVYLDITKEHDVNVKVTQTYVRNFMKGIINDVKQTTHEKWPKCMNLDVIVKSIVDSLPKSLALDDFYSYVAEYLVAKSSQHYFYDFLASYIAVKRIHSITTPDFLLTAKLLQENLDKNNDQSPILSDEVFDIISRHHVRLQDAIQYSRDFDFDYFGIKTMERSYLYKLLITKFKIIERPQHMIMRVALGIHGEDIDSAIETYNLISQKFFTHATPTLFNAGTKRPQMSSCFLQAVDDSIESIFKAVTDVALTSKWSGGIGVHLSSLRSRGSLIRGTNGLSSGIIPLCVLLNKLAKYINQGGKRNGSIAAYLEPHHPDIFDFCELRKNTGNDDNRARDLYLALWVSSLFMERVRNEEMWSLMCPDECPGLNLVHSEEYNKLYEKYESEGRYVKQVKAQELWKHILEAQSETGFPYILYKDNANKKSNQKNLGTIRSSNLCAEIIQYSDDEETAVCFTADTEIVTKNGIRKIIDCDQVDVLSYFDNDTDLNHYEHFEKATLIHNGRKQVYKLTTRGNKPIKVTNNHPILVKTTVGEIKWKKISELESDDDMVHTPNIKPINGFDFNINNDLIDEWLNYGRTYSIDVFQNIHNPTPIQIANFLSGLFSEHGFIDHRENYLAIDLMSTTLKEHTRYDAREPNAPHRKIPDGILLYDIQSLLISFGIASRVEYIDHFNIGTLLICGKTNIKRFMKCIGFKLCPDKDLRCAEKYDIVKNTNHAPGSYSKIISIIPLGFEDVYDLSLPESHNYIANGHVVHNCNLSSICLPMYIKANSNGKKTFNYEKLIKVCRVAVRNLDKIIDRNYYPTEKTRRSNMRHRPMGIGVQGLADVYNIMGFSFDSLEAYDINKRIFETIYYACIDESKELAKRFGPYSTFKGSPASQGKLQFHLWGVNEDQLLMGYDWKKLIDEVIKYGLRNSLLTALMPTASTSQIMGNAECMEPYMSNIFKRSTNAGEFIVANKNLMKDLINLDLWDNDMRKRLIIENGSVQSIDIIPENIKAIYRTAFEIKQMHIVHQSADRGIFIDQSQSLNLFMPEPDFDILTSALFDGHDLGIKTGMYYYRSLPAINPINFGIDVDDIKRLTGRDVNTGSYNINRSDEVLVQKKVDTDEGQKISSTHEAASNNMIVSTNKVFCKWVPGMKLEDCLECGS